MKLNKRNVIRIFFLLLIFTLWFMGKADIWGPILGISLLIVPLFGRIYCGWICPIYTTLDIMAPVLKKPLFKPKENLMTNPYFLGVLVVIYAVIMATVIKTNFIVPFFILLIPVGIIVSYLFGGIFWHRICFFGIIFSLFGKLSRKGYVIDPEGCIKCKKCVRKCPNGCIETNEEDYKVNARHCLSCGICKETCPTTTISYTKR